MVFQIALDRASGAVDNLHFQGLKPLLKLEREPMKTVCKGFVPVVFVGLFFAAGCGEHRRTEPQSIRDGLPSPIYQVGGGFLIDFTAFDDGIVYVVDQSSRRILGMKTVEKGDNFSFDLPDYADDLGITPTTKIGLYFVPLKVFVPAASETQ